MIANSDSNAKLEAKRRVNVVSFGFKNGDAPRANVVLDVRFLKNPFWVEELRPLTGREKPVRDYVMEQQAAQLFLEKVLDLVSHMIPVMFVNQAHVESFTIALGCTGGQHRSVAIAEEVAKAMTATHPEFHVTLAHRELDQISHDHAYAMKEGDGHG